MTAALPSRPCKQCKVAFKPRRSAVRFCSKSCVMTARNAATVHVPIVHPPCAIDGCSRPRRGVGAWCTLHAQRVYRTGSTYSSRDRRPIIDGDVAYIPLTQGLSATIDIADLPAVSPFLWSVGGGAADEQPYAFSRGAGGLLHRVILGIDDETLVVDHIDHDTLNNRRSNLRRGVAGDNSRNRLVGATSKSGYIGVSWRPDKRCWRAYVGINGLMHHVGHFLTAEAAARARDDYVRDNDPSEFWSYNFPRPGEQGARVDVVREFEVVAR